jgi:hypothetical protein
MTRTGAFLAGLLLFALPFFQSGLGDASPHGDAGHMDHAPHHGGSLLMLGEHHLEVVDRDGNLEVYLSDAARRPVRTTFATIAFDDGEAGELAWKGYRLVAAKPALYRTAEYRLGVAGAAPLVIRLPAAGVSMPREQARPAASGVSHVVATAPK